MIRLKKKRECIWNCTTPITPRIFEKIRKGCEKARKIAVYYGGDSHYKVWEKLGTHTLILNNGTYDCKIWDMSGIPCLHACAAIQVEHGTVERFVHYYYSKET